MFDSQLKLNHQKKCKKREFVSLLFVMEPGFLAFFSAHLNMRRRAQFAMHTWINNRRFSLWNSVWARNLEKKMRSVNETENMTHLEIIVVVSSFGARAARLL